MSLPLTSLVQKLDNKLSHVHMREQAHKWQSYMCIFAAASVQLCSTLPKQQRTACQAQKHGEMHLQHDQVLLLVHMSLTKLAVQQRCQDLHFMLGGTVQISFVQHSLSLCFQLLQLAQLPC